MFLIVLVVGIIVTATALKEVQNETGPDLDCTHILDDHMFCQFKAQNCSGYHLTLARQQEGIPEVKECIPMQCDSGGCCCTLEMFTIFGDKHTARIWREGEIMETKMVDISKSIKPRSPAIVSVDNINGNFEVKWKTNLPKTYIYMFSSYVTYHKKGDPQMDFQLVQPPVHEGLNVYTIRGKDLEPRTTYVVIVKTFTNRSQRFSDESNAFEFTTPANGNSLLLALIIGLSIAAVLISSAIYVCYLKLKTQWWDIVSKGPNPKLLIMNSYDKQLLKSESPIISSACIEPLTPDDSKPWLKGSLTDTSSGSFQQSSGINTGSSCLSYANTGSVDIIAGVQDALLKAFPNISPVSALTNNPLTGSNKDSGLFSTSDNPCVVRAYDTNCSSSGLDNKTYSIVIPNFPQQIMMDSSEVQKEVSMVCDSSYHPSEGEMVTSPDQQVPVCPLLSLPQMISSVMPSDMSYQPCNADSGQLSDAEESSLSSFSSGTSTTTSDPASKVQPGIESLDTCVGGPTRPNRKSDAVIICDDNPCYNHVPAGSHSFPQVSDDYQAFQSLVGQPEVLFSEERGAEREEDLDKDQVESSTQIHPVTPGVINNVQVGQGFSELHTPFLSRISADEPVAVITDSGYQRV